MNLWLGRRHNYYHGLSLMSLWLGLRHIIMDSDNPLAQPTPYYYGLSLMSPTLGLRHIIMDSL